MLASNNDLDSKNDPKCAYLKMDTISHFQAKYQYWRFMSIGLILCHGPTKPFLIYPPLDHDHISHIRSILDAVSMLWSIITRGIFYVLAP